MMPTFLGQPLYPGGAPVPAENIDVFGQTIEQIKYKYFSREATGEEKEILKEYVLYYIGAPIFLLSFENDSQEQYFKTMSLDRILELLLDAGLDPL